jgi:putative phosphoesterase
LGTTIAMKLALLGDIHGNHLALKAVLDAARHRGVERLLITGDFIGYYFWPKEALALLAQWEFAAVRGNHEDMLAKARSNKEILHAIGFKHGTGLQVALEQLNQQQLDMLSFFPHPLDLDIEGCRILLCHGSPQDNACYIYPDTELEVLTRCAVQDVDLVVMGHTHYPLCRQIEKTLLVNPGSVGQPRNYRPGAHWALFDSESREISLYCEKYDLGRVVSEAGRRHPEIPYLAKVLERI